MKHLEINAKCTGDGITAISSCQKLAKAYGEDIHLEFKEGFSVQVRPNSDVQDLIQIWMLERKVREGKK